MKLFLKNSLLQYLFLKDVYESINLARLITYSPYFNKFEKPLLNMGKGFFFCFIINVPRNNHHLALSILG